MLVVERGRARLNALPSSLPMIGYFVSISEMTQLVETES